MAVALFEGTLRYVFFNGIAVWMSYLGWAAAGLQSVRRFSQSSVWCSLRGSSGFQSEHPAQSSPPGPASPLCTEAEHTNLLVNH